MSVAFEFVAVVALPGCLVVIALEWLNRFKIVDRMGWSLGVALCAANTALFLFAVESATALALVGSGLLLSDIHLTIVLVGLVPTIGFAIAFTRLVTGTLRRPDENIEALSVLIASEAQKSSTPAERMSELMRSSIEHGQLTREGARKVLELISAKHTDLTRHVERAMRGLE